MITTLAATLRIQMISGHSLRRKIPSETIFALPDPRLTALLDSCPPEIESSELPDAWARTPRPLGDDVPIDDPEMKTNLRIYRQPIRLGSSTQRRARAIAGRQDPPTLAAS